MRFFKKESVKPFVASQGEIIHQYTGRLEKNGGSQKHSLALMTILPGCSSEPHAHQIAEESFLVIRGRSIIQVNGQAFEVKEGDCVFVEPGETHAVINTGPEPLEVVLATGPAWQPYDTVSEDAPQSKESRSIAP